MLRIKSVSILVAVAVVLIASAAPSVFADSITFNLDVASTLGNSNYGTVTMTLVNSGSGGQKIKIEVVLNNGARLIQTGHDASVAFNMDDPDLQIGLYNTTLPAGFALINSGNAGTLKMNGQGTFEYGISGPSPSDTSAPSSLTFTVSRTGGFTSVFDLVDLSDKGSVFAVNVLLTQNCSSNCTGVVGTSYGTASVSVPEPTAILLLGSGLASLGLMLGRFRKKQHEI